MSASETQRTPEATAPAADFTVQNEGSIFLVRPRTEQARQHFEYTLPEDAHWFGPSLVVEHRYIADMVACLLAAGFTVR